MNFKLPLIFIICIPAYPNKFNTVSVGESTVKIFNGIREEARAEERITNISAILLKGGSEEQAKMFLDATDDEIKKARDIMAK